MVNLPMSAAASSRKPAEQQPGLGYTLAATCLFLVLVALVTASLFTAWVDQEQASRVEPPVAGTVLKTIGGQRYSFPASLIPIVSQRQPGFADRLDLVLPVALGQDTVTLALAIVPRGRAIASARLLDSVYVHQFTDGEVPGVRGLVGKPLDGSAAYRNETVWYDPLSISPFVAKCTTPVASAGPGDDCLRVAPLGDRNLAILTFGEALLPHWREFDAAIDAALAPYRL